MHNFYKKSQCPYRSLCETANDFTRPGGPTPAGRAAAPPLLSISRHSPDEPTS